uniref:Chromate transporter n=1 Tax=Thermosporothrix sp. COM3 TaxID=2490863 RepID=A0A455SJN6_9CHLR|nr:chromate transporter [Thermosporothrix sp. COM3]
MSESKQLNHRGRLAEVAGVFLRLGCTAFGGPAAHIAMMREEVVRRRRWVDDQTFLDLLGVVNLIPGPNSTELAIHLGYVRAGWPGLIVAGVCFIVPAMLIVLAFAWAYVTFGSLPQVGWLLYGIKPVIIAIVAISLWGLGKTVLRGWFAVVMAALLMGLYLLNVNEVLVLFGGGIAYALLRTLGRKLHLFSCSLPSLLLFAPMHATPEGLLTLFLTFLKIGAILYGSGYVLLAFLRDDFVLSLHWLTDQQLLDAITVGQFTPGPVFTTSTFVGYLIAGWQGALLATLGIFLPSFIFVGLIHRLASTLRRFVWTSLLLDGVNTAAFALMGGVLLQLGQQALPDPLTWGIALGALLILLRWNVNSAWLILAGAAIGLLRYWWF